MSLGKVPKGRWHQVSYYKGKGGVDVMDFARLVSSLRLDFQTCVSLCSLPHTMAGSLVFTLLFWTNHRQACPILAGESLIGQCSHQSKKMAAIVPCMFKIEKFRENQEKVMLNLVNEKKCFFCSLRVHWSWLFSSAFLQWMLLRWVLSLCGCSSCVLVCYFPHQSEAVSSTSPCFLAVSHLAIL